MNYSYYIKLFIAIAVVTLSIISLMSALQFMMILTSSSRMLWDLTIFLEYIVLFPIYLLDSSIDLEAGVPLTSNFILLSPLFWASVAVAIAGYTRKRVRHNQSLEKDAAKKRGASQP